MSRKNRVTYDRGFGLTGVLLMSLFCGLVLTVNAYEIKAPGDLDSDDHFGFAVDASDQFLVIGAYGDDDGDAGANNDEDETDAGAVYIYKRSTDGGWESTPFKISDTDDTDIDLSTNDHFGYSVAVHGNYLAVGTQANKVYVYRYQDPNWVCEDTVTGTGSFGQAVDIYGDYLVVGAPEQTVDSLTSAGAAYVYKRNGQDWESFGSELHEPNGAPDFQYDWIGSDHYFGTSLAIHGNFIIVGAPGYGLWGIACVFQIGASDVSLVTPAGVGAQSRGESNTYGQAVAISDKYIVIGEPGYSSSGAGGAIYVYEKNDSDWVDSDFVVDTVSQEEKIAGAGDTAAGDNFGHSLAIGDKTILVGAPGHTVNSASSGKAYMLMNRSTSGWTEFSSLDLDTAASAGDNVGGQVAYSGDDIVVGADGYSDGGAVLIESFNDTIVFEFDDYGWTEECFATAPSFSNSGSLDVKAVALIGGQKTVYADNPGSSAIYYPPTSTYQLQLKNGDNSYFQVDWGTRFFVQAKVNRQSSSGIIYLVSSSNVRWYIDGYDNNKMKLTLNNSYTVESTSTVSLPEDTWSTLSLAVDLGSNSVKMYQDGSDIGTSESGSIPASVNSDSTVSILYESCVEMKCDYFKIVTNAVFDTEGNVSEEVTHEEEHFVEISEDSSASILIHPAQVLKPISNPPSQLRDNYVLDGTANIITDLDNTIFHGIYRIQFGLETEDFDGQLKVTISIHKPEYQENEFRKIGTKTVDTDDAPTDGSTWLINFYWNTRVPAAAPAGDDADYWNADDAQPYYTAEDISIKFEVE